MIIEFPNLSMVSMVSSPEVLMIRFFLQTISTLNDLSTDSADSEETPVFDAKGIETIRRVQQLKLLFEEPS